jgi:hypothetical protein
VCDRSYVGAIKMRSAAIDGMTNAIGSDRSARYDGVMKSNGNRKRRTRHGKCNGGAEVKSEGDKRVEEDQND